MLGSIVAVQVREGQQIKVGDTLIVMEVMKVHSNIKAPISGFIGNIRVNEADAVEQGQPLLQISNDDVLNGESSARENSGSENLETEKPSDETELTQGTPTSALQEFKLRQARTLDESRQAAREKRHAKGYRTARENLADLCDVDSFIEYGQFAVAAQRGRIDYQELQSATASDGIITGVASVNAELLGSENTKTAIIINDYSVLAGTQGYYHHKKLDRILAVAEQQRLPLIMYTEGGGGRPGDTDINTVNSGLQCESFGSWAALSGLVPRIAVGNGYNFAGNAALFGAADITIATKKSWIGMAGPAMIAGGGLGDFKPTEIGPIETQHRNGVVDIVADDEQHASDLARCCLAMFQGRIKNWESPNQQNINQVLPDNRLFTYPVRDIINVLADVDSFIEIRAGFGGAIVSGFIRLEGRPVGLIANDCSILGGAIDVDAGEKAAEFIKLCDQFNIPIVSLCDTPGFMVGPEHEELGAVRRLAKLFTAGAHIKVPLVAVILRKCYGLGAQAMVGGSTSRPVFTASWPSGEFGPMGLEGGVKLGFKKELEAVSDPIARQKLFDELLSQAYQRGQATEVASVLEIDALIDPIDTRASIIQAFAAAEQNLGNA